MKMQSMCRAGCSVAMVLLLSSISHAGFVAGFSGNSYLDEAMVSSLGANDGHVSFSVYQNEGTSTETWFNNNLSLAAGEYAYFYQVVNSGTNSDSLTSLFVSLNNAGGVNDAGVIDGVVFNDDVGTVGSTNYGFGDESTATSSPTFFTPDSDFNNNFASNDSGAANGTADIKSNAVQFDFSAIGANGYTSLLYFTSNSGPKFGSAGVWSPPTTGGGGLPVPAPLPGALALLLGGIPFVGLLRWKMG